MDKNGRIEKIETETFPLGIQEVENKDLVVKFINIKDKSMYCFTDGLLEPLIITVFLMKKVLVLKSLSKN